MSVDSGDAPPPPPPPPPPPDYSVADQPVIDEGPAAPDNPSSASADVNGHGTLDSTGDPAPADVPVADEGRAAPDLSTGETSSQSSGGDADASGSAERVPVDPQANMTEADKTSGGSAIDEAVPASAVADEQDAIRDVGSTQDEFDSGTALDDEVPESQAESAGISPSDSGEQTSASDRPPGADSSDRTDEPDSAVADAKAIELDTNAGSAYYGPDDVVMRNAAQDVEPEAGYHTVDMHGSPDDPNHVYFQNENGSQESLSADQLANVIRDNDDWDGQPVRLFSCYTGQDPPGAGEPYGQQLADTLGVEVKAPTTWVDNDSYGNPVLPSGGEWRIFQPRKL